MAAAVKSGTTDAPLSELQGVSHDFQFPNGKPMRVLEGINLASSSRRIEIVRCLLGPSRLRQASTILRILAGLIEPHGGRSCRPLHHAAPLTGLNLGVAIVFQSFALYPWMTVAQNAEMVLKAAGRPAAEVVQRSEHSVQLVGLQRFRELLSARELSGGMSSNSVGIARAWRSIPRSCCSDERPSARSTP